MWKKKLFFFGTVLANFVVNINSYTQQHVDLLKSAQRKGNVTCKNCDFSGANLQGYILPNIDVEGSDFSDANLSGLQAPNSNFQKTNLQRANLNDSILDKTDFSYASAHKTQFVNSHLDNCKFLNTNLALANFTDSKCHFTNFGGAHFDQTSFYHSDLWGAGLIGATGGIETDDRTSFCCTIMPNKNFRTEPNGLCTLQQMQVCDHHRL